MKLKSMCCHYFQWQMLGFSGMVWEEEKKTQKFLIHGSLLFSIIKTSSLF